MGTYIGIYLEVPYATKKVEKTIYKNPTTGLPMKTAFNPNTGEKAIVETTLVDERVRPTPFEFEGMDGFDAELFFSPEFDGAGDYKKTFVINYTYNRYRIPFEGDRESFNIEFPDINVLQLIREFREEYSKYIDYLENNFGPVAVKYGVVHYYH